MRGKGIGFQGTWLSVVKYSMADGLRRVWWCGCSGSGLPLAPSMGSRDLSDIEYGGPAQVISLSLS